MSAFHQAEKDDCKVLIYNVSCWLWHEKDEAAGVRAGGRIVPQQQVVIHHGVIQDISPSPTSLTEDVKLQYDVIVDGQQRLLLPGLIGK